MEFTSLISDPNAWIALATLTGLEIVLGVDNIIFIAILVGRLPKEKRQKARILGLSLAMGTRILLLLSLFWIMKLTSPLFELFEHGFSGRDLILLFGGLFLMAKSTLEIHHNIDLKEDKDKKSKINVAKGFVGILIQIALLDIIFSLDSVITAVGMVNQIEIMVLAVVIAVFIMMAASKSISDFIDKHPTLKMMALAFLILVGVALMGEGLGFHIPKGYIYFSMAFALAVESLNIYAKSKNKE
ncbi:MAG: TerC family protein [Campylobacteraceae bacterium]|jgi:predicted tellurium resistance membrane protein TerC|nr:TerC family protein [Campylobacteraceae bacterium]